MADTPTTTAFSGVASGKTVTFTDREKFQIQQDAKRISSSMEFAGRPFMGISK